MELNKNQIIQIKVEKLIPGGEGLGHFGDLAIFIPLSVPEDILEVKIISIKKNYARGLINKIITPGIDRIQDLSKITFEDLQGCDFAMLNYNAQLKYKKEIVADVMDKIGKSSNVYINEVVSCDKPHNYRNKIIEPFAKYKGQIISGFFQKRSHDVFQVEENILNSILGNRIIKKLKEILNREKISVYDEESHKGILRNVMIRTNSFDQAMVVLIVNDNKVDKKYIDILKELESSITNIISSYVSLNNQNTNVALGKENILVSGSPSIKEDINGIKFNISPLSFFQINLDQAKKLYNIAIDLFDDIENKNIVDAYSGTGTIAMLLSKKAKKVYAIEIVKSSTQDGEKTSKENNINNIEFINGKVENELPKLTKKGIKIDSIIFDPPRKGIEENILKDIAKHNINEIVYISCNPATFARDAKILTDLGYSIGQMTPVDMFPQTSHVECVGKFYLKK